MTDQPPLSNEFPIPDRMKAWVLGGPDEMFLVDKPVPQPAAAEVLVRIDAVAICATDLEILRHGVPAMVEGGLPFNKNFTIGHEYMGTVVKLGPAVDEYRIGDRVTVEVHAGCGRCERCRQGMYTSCLNYGDVAKGHRANGFTTDGGFAEYAVNHVNTLVHVPDDMTDEEATLVVTAGTSMYGLDVLGGLIAGEGVVVTGPGPIGLLGVAVAKALGADPVILTGTRDARLELGKKLGADHVINARREDPVAAVRRITAGRGRAVRRRMLGRARGAQRGGADGQPRRPDLPGRFPAGPGAGRPSLSRAQQHLCLRDSRRGPERHSSGDGADEAEAVRCPADPHPHLPARRAADRPQIRPRANRRCDQGRGQSWAVSCVDTGRRRAYLRPLRMP